MSSPNKIISSGQTFSANARENTSKPPTLFEMSTMINFQFSNSSGNTPIHRKFNSTIFQFKTIVSLLIQIYKIS